METAPPATEPAAPPAMEAMPAAVEPAAVAAPELTPPGMSHEATSGTRVDRTVQQVVVGHEVLLEVVKQDEVNVVQAHVGHEPPKREGKELGHPLAPCRVPRRGEGKGEHDGAEYHHDGHEDALRHEDAVVGHLKNQLAHEADDVVNPFADLGLRGHHRPLGVVVDSVA